MTVLLVIGVVMLGSIAVGGRLYLLRRGVQNNHAHGKKWYQHVEDGSPYGD